MTEKLFYKDQYQPEFHATVLDCRQEGKRYAIILDKTCFYPEGGGQPADKGTLNGIAVDDVQEKDGEILHYTKEALQPGSAVQGTVEMDYRFLLMQQHSGEHIFSGIANRLYGCNNIGFHMGSDFITVDFDVPLTEEKITEAEKRANQVVYQNLAIRTFVPDEKDREKCSYRSKKQLSGEVRLVEIPGIDCCACCGLHTARTGEIGMIKVLDFQNYKGGTRLFLQMGSAAFADYVHKNHAVHSVSTLLSERNIAAGVRRLLQERDSIKQNLYQRTVQYVGVLVQTQGPVFFVEGFGYDELRALCNKQLEQTAHAAAFSQCSEGYRYIVASQADAREFCKAINARFSGKGGGNAKMCQGVISPASAAELQEYVLGLFQA